MPTIARTKAEIELISAVCNARNWEAAPDTMSRIMTVLSADLSKIVPYESKESAFRKAYLMSVCNWTIKEAEAFLERWAQEVA